MAAICKRKPGPPFSELYSSDKPLFLLLDSSFIGVLALSEGGVPSDSWETMHFRGAFPTVWNNPDVRVRRSHVIEGFQKRMKTAFVLALPSLRRDIDFEVLKI